MKQQQGFTLIELIVVIVILGILAATALPKFVDMSTEAKVAAAKGVLGAAQSAGMIAHASKQLGKTVTLITDGTSLGANLEGGIPSGWVADDTGGAGNVGICTNDQTTAGDCSTASYFVKINTLQTATTAPVFGKGGTATW